jgi:catechol 2,3-dioxygenase
METSTVTANASGSSSLLSDSTRLGAVELTVTDLERSIAFYRDVIGLTVLSREEARAALGAGDEELVVLHEEPGARRPGRESGIYHFALLYPTREELARAGMRIVRTRTPIEGASDHGTHEAIYLPDPDGIGVELAADREREFWPNYEDSEFARGGPNPLDVRNLLASVAEEEPQASARPGLRVGHVHLHVGDLERSTRFYRDGIGFEVVAELPAAIFVSFGRYHHHVAYNLWRGRGAPPAGSAVTGLRQWTLILDSDDDLAAARERLTALGARLESRDGGLLAHDPANIAVLLAVRQ